MNNILGAMWLSLGLAGGFYLAMGSCYPSMAFPGPPAAQETVLGRDPSYEWYRDYRYTMDTYVYLFFDESTGGADADGMGSGGTILGSASGAGVSASEGGAYQSDVDEQGVEGAGAGGPGADGSVAGSGPGVSSGTGESIPSLAQLQDYDFLMKSYYSVHPSTTAPRELMQASELLGTDLTLEQDFSVPQILIYHTHSQETFAGYGPGNPEGTVVGIGNRLTELLRDRGWNVIHDTTAYDIKGGELDRSRAYTYALEGITRILEENPTIQVVLDIHRDGVREDLRLVAQVEGKPTANIMFFQGMSRTPEGPIEYLPNPYLKENLAFGLQLQREAARLYPGFTRKIYLKGLRYNLHLRPRSALIEVGAQTSSGEEAMNAMEPLAELLDRVLQGR